MLFHTWTFLVFFLVFYPGYLLLKGTRFRLPWLLTASYVFYGWWNPVYLLLILWATTVDFLAVLAMAKTRQREAVAGIEHRQQPGIAGLLQVRDVCRRQRECPG